MAKPATHKRTPRKRTIREARTGPASDAIGSLTPGIETYILTHGQFSLIDALVYLGHQTGPCDLTVSVWTAGDQDLQHLAALLGSGQFRNVRFLVDRSFITRQPDYCARLRSLFGDGCIRTARTHAKFCTVRNERWTLAVRTSMNLNFNPRLESIEISDDAELCEFLDAEVSRYFADQPPGTFDAEMTTPAATGVTVGTVTATRLYRTLPAIS